MMQARGRMMPDRAGSNHRWLAAALQIPMIMALAGFASAGAWLSAAITLMAMSLIITPALLRMRLYLRVPPAPHALVAVFVFCSLFLGEALDFYERVWWWDLALHFCAGLMLAAAAFVLVALSAARIPAGMAAVFAFCFALALGATWEIFEFSFDAAFGAQTQRAMFGDNTGLTDTMWDLIFDALGAGAFALYGWFALKRTGMPVIDRWTVQMALENPHLFGGRAAPEPPRAPKRASGKRRAWPHESAPAEAPLSRQQPS